MRWAEATPPTVSAAPQKRPAGQGGGFSLVEVLIAGGLVAGAALVAVPTFSLYIKRSRTAEAVAHLSRMWAGSVTYYEVDHYDESGRPLPRAFPARDREAPAESARECGCLEGGRCPGGAAVWKDPAWTALQFSLPAPHLYIPRYSSSNTGGAATFTARATGDLDCDGHVAVFQREGRIDANGDVVGSKAPVISDELE